MKSRSKPLLTSKRDWLRQRLLARLRGVDQAIVTDAALKQLADMAARRLCSGRGYGEVTHALWTVNKVIDALATIDRGAAAPPIGAAELKRLAEAGRIPRLAPWF